MMTLSMTTLVVVVFLDKVKVDKKGGARGQKNSRYLLVSYKISTYSYVVIFGGRFFLIGSKNLMSQKSERGTRPAQKRPQIQSTSYYPIRGDDEDSSCCRGN